MKNVSFIQLGIIPDDEAVFCLGLVKTLNTGKRRLVSLMSKAVFARTRKSDPDVLARIPPGLTSNQHDSIFRAATNKVKTAVALKREEIKRLGGMIREQKSSILETQAKLANALVMEKSKSAGFVSTKGKGKAGNKKIKFALSKKTERLERLEFRLERAVRSLRDERISIVFGGKALARQGNQTSDRSSPFNSKREWKNAWENARDGKWLFEGHKTASSSNDAVKVEIDENGRITLKVQLSLEQKAARLAVLAKEAGLTLEEALNPTKHHSIRMKAGYAFLQVRQPKDSNKSQRRKHEEFKSVIERSDRPVSWQVLITKGRAGKITDFQMRASWESEIPDVSSSNRRNGALGIDVNAKSIDWAVVDGQGNWTGENGSIPMAWRGSKDRAIHEIREACKTLTDLAGLHEVPIALESLDFSKKKLEMKHNKTSKLSKMLSGFAYSSFRKELVSMAAKKGVELVFVEPSWTSITGFVLHTLPSRRLSINQGAGVAIGRRAVLSKGSDIVLATVAGLPGKQGVRSRNEKLPDGLIERLGAIDGLASKETKETKSSCKSVKGSKTNKGTVAKRVGKQGAVRRSTNPFSGALRRLVLVLGRDRRLWRKRGSPLLPEGSLKQRDRPTEGDRSPARLLSAEPAGTSRPDPE